VTLLSGRDHTATLRFTWLPTAGAAADHVRGAALRRVLQALTGPAAAPALRSAGLRPPDGIVGKGPSVSVAAASGAPASPSPAGPLPGGPSPAAASPADAVPGAVPGAARALTAEPFGVLDPHHIDHVFATWYPQNRRMNLLIVTDVSGSMADPAPGTATPLIDLVRDGSRSVAALLPTEAALGVWEFGVQLDAERDYRPLVAAGPLTDPHRADLSRALDGLAARETGTGLYDTILAAYQSARDNYRPGVPNQVLLFTDGRNQDDPNTITAAQLAERLTAAKDPDRPVQLTVVTFGQLPDAGLLTDVVKPVDGYVEALSTADEVAAAFIHVSAGGLHGP
jgi:hypothetical protein